MDVAKVWTLSLILNLIGGRNFENSDKLVRQQKSQFKFEQLSKVSKQFSVICSQRV
jgi:hypothetical protein